MNWKEARRAAMAACLSVAFTGCAQDRVVEAPEPPTQASIPMAVRGQDTIFRLSFPQRDQKIEPGQFQNGEICYLTVGDFRVNCFNDGSTLDLGPNDSTDLLTDNPMWNLEPAHDDKAAGDSMKLYSILFLVGGTVDRLPGTLANYIQDPSQHLAEAVVLAELLLNQRRVEFQGFARGGSFSVSVELTTAGREKLMDALDDAGEPAGTTQLVSHHTLLLH
jgi:hypothetical protein